MENDQETNDQARVRARNWLVMAKAEIDRQFDDGYAKANPELLAASLQAIALAWHGDRLEALTTAGESLQGTLASLNTNICTLGSQRGGGE